MFRRPGPDGNAALRAARMAGSKEWARHKGAGWEVWGGMVGGGCRQVSGLLVGKFRGLMVVVVVGI